MGGWSVAVDPASGTLTGALAWFYNRNYTQYGCGNGCLLQVIEGAQFTLGGLPSPAAGAQPQAAFLNTSTGLPLVGEGGGGGAVGGWVGGAPVTLQLPPFSQDVALWVEWV